MSLGDLGKHASENYLICPNNCTGTMAPLGDVSSGPKDLTVKLYTPDELRNHLISCSTIQKLALAKKAPLKQSQPETNNPELQSQITHLAKQNAELVKALSD